MFAIEGRSAVSQTRALRSCFLHRARPYPRRTALCRCRLHRRRPLSTRRFYACQDPSLSDNSNVAVKTNGALTDDITESDQQSVSSSEEGGVQLDEVLQRELRENGLTHLLRSPRQMGDVRISKHKEDTCDLHDRSHQ